MCWFESSRRHSTNSEDILYFQDLVAQLVEQYTFNVWVLGSNPSQVTSKLIRSDTVFFCLRGEIGRHAILRGWFPKDVLVRVQSQAQQKYF